MRTGQVRMAITLKLPALSLLGSQTVWAKLFVEAAQTQAHLAAIDCADASDPVHRVVVDAEPGSCGWASVNIPTSTTRRIRCRPPGVKPWTRIGSLAFLRR